MGIKIKHVVLGDNSDAEQAGDEMSILLDKVAKSFGKETAAAMEIAFNLHEIAMHLPPFLVASQNMTLAELETHATPIMEMLESSHRGVMKIAARGNAAIEMTLALTMVAMQAIRERAVKQVIDADENAAAALDAAKAAIDKAAGPSVH